MFHRHRLASPRQAAVENRVDLAGLGLARDFDAEAPGFDALLPVRAHEAVVVAQAGADDERRPGAYRFRRAAAVDGGPALSRRCGRAETSLPSQRDPHFGAGHRLAAVEDGDPDQAIVAAHLGDAPPGW